MPKKKIFIPLLVIVLLGGVGYYFYSQQQNKPAGTEEPQELFVDNYEHITNEGEDVPEGEFEAFEEKAKTLENSASAGLYRAGEYPKSDVYGTVYLASDAEFIYLYAEMQAPELPENEYYRGWFWNIHDELYSTGVFDHVGNGNFVQTFSSDLPESFDKDTAYTITKEADGIIPEGVELEFIYDAFFKDPGYGVFEDVEDPEPVTIEFE